MPKINITIIPTGPTRHARWALALRAVVFITIAAPAFSIIRADEHAAATQPSVQSEPTEGASQKAGTQVGGGDEAESTAAAMLKDRRVRRWWFTMGWGLFIIAAFLASASAIIIFSRRFQSWVGRKPPEPTNCEDAWSMHVAPPIDDVPDDPRAMIGEGGLTSEEDDAGDAYDDDSDDDWNDDDEEGPGDHRS